MGTHGVCPVSLELYNTMDTDVADDVLDFAVGFGNVVPVGAQVDDVAAPLAVVHAADRDAAEQAAAAYVAACRFADQPPAQSDVITGRRAADRA